MKIITISDTHYHHDEMDIPDGDIVLCGGDVTRCGSRSDMEDFLKWYGDLSHKHKVLIAGNHDFIAEIDDAWMRNSCSKKGVIYLNDSGCKIEGIKIWGSPVQPEFCNWAFNRSRTMEDSVSLKAQANGHGYIGNHWDLIPEDIDILITHGPPMNVLDKTFYGYENVGCSVLRNHIERIRPKMHVFGHIHEERGIELDLSVPDKPITYVNASMVNLQYQVYTDDCYVFDWDEVLEGKSYGIR